MRNEDGWTSEPLTITDYTNPPIFRGGLGDPNHEISQRYINNLSGGCGIAHEPLPEITPATVELGGGRDEA